MLGTRARRQRRGRRGFRRTWQTAAASTALLGLTVAFAPGGAAQGAPAEAEIGNGTAKAVAVIARYAPGVGNLSLGITNGTAVTQVTNALAQATSQTTDLGLIGGSLTSESCGDAGSLKPEDLPQPTFVDNREGDTAESRDESGTDGSPLGFGRMQVEALQEPPAATARTTAAAFEVPDALRLGGGVARAETRVLPGEGREALATVRSSLSIEGVLELEGMRWFAHHRTGLEPLAEGGFDVGRAEVGGLPFPTDDLGALEEAVNTALAPSGITVSFPRATHQTEPNDLMRVTPMRIVLRDSPAGKATLGPALTLTREQRSELFDQLAAAYCKSAGLLLVGDIAVSVAAGTGFLVVELGGVEASSADLVLTNPFGEIPPLTAGPAATPAVSGGAPLGGGGGSGTDTGLLPTSPPSTVPGGGAQRPRPVRATGPVEELCESLHPKGASCSEGAAAAVGVVGLLATVGMAGADVVRQRRQALLGEV